MYLRSFPKTYQGHPVALKDVVENICVIGSNNMQPMPGAALSSPYLFSSYKDRRSATEPYRRTVLTIRICTHSVRNLFVSLTSPWSNFERHHFLLPFLCLKLLWSDWAKRRDQDMELFVVLCSSFHFYALAHDCVVMQKKNAGGCR
jgi:hypothetical protein